MATNPQLSLSNTVKILENGSEVASRSLSGVFNLGEYVQIIDVVAPGTDDKEYSFGTLATFDFVFIETDQPISVMFNASTGETAFDIEPEITSGTTGYGMFCATVSALTSLFISNASGTTSAKVRLILGNYA